MKIILLFASTVLLLANDSSAGDREDIVAHIEQTWREIALKKPIVNMGHPDGQWVATSQGGLWEFLSPEEFGSMITDSPNVLAFKPYHINVSIVGEKQDVAYAAYYLVGNILDADHNPIVKNYRTRASEVSVKIDGKWLQIGGHYSPLYGGSGVKLD